VQTGDLGHFVVQVQHRSAQKCHVDARRGYEK